ncbi:hypothetical protein HH214_10625 [Mucilaginibacter robiniae]|uniref:Uncharacterized protein n=1 Tax=Mucilaginibacter robiniae TaxID=2728022 RepID=A0A7L5E3P6_9SPHI|nr:hypothetical protein [Mucilaginibacter robiniae]QJD96284.1 hypothetical protein HH214_10625 [Mucilaginibacter robiniae]
MILGLILLTPPASLGDEDFAYFKYSGKLVASGYLDARKAALALQGIDEVMRFFIIQQNKALIQYDFDIPIQLRRGSWEAVIPQGFGEWLSAVTDTSDSTTTHTLADQEFKEVRTKNVVKAAIKSIKWVLQISKHMGSLSIRKFKSVKFEGAEKPEVPMIGLENGRGEVLYVPEEYLEMYRNCPDSLFDKLMQIVEQGREFEVGFSSAVALDKDDVNARITISIDEKYIFTEEESEETVLFPEWKHGDVVTLEGHITRGNEKANTIGFLFDGHVITCSPLNGNITDYKNVLFTNCLMRGEVDRSGQHNFGNEKRPHIKFSSLKGLSNPNVQLTLFG